MDENGICDQHGRNLDHPWGCFCCAQAEWLAQDETTWEPGWPTPDKIKQRNQLSFDR
ncbi:hypothetical protein ACFWPU_00885 [Streptomyces sp. NPDC058471]|uniref:hypothetical protein n=1 Tax=Streptomyces sp. NPDC058471 TaxID=3346516 RepID=UPI00365DB603